MADAEAPPSASGSPAPGLAHGLPARQAAELRALLARPGPWAASADTLAAWEGTTRPQINGARGLGALPLAVLSVTEQAHYAGVLTGLQAELPSLSSNSVHRTVHGATHEGLVSRREHALVVADAIREPRRRAAALAGPADLVCAREGEGNDRALAPPAAVRGLPRPGGGSVPAATAG